MPTRIIIFNVVQLLACAYALWRGGEPERWTAWMMAMAAAATGVVIYELGIPMHAISPSLLMVDLAFLLGLMVLALKANRFWPMWVAALQLLAITVHIVRGVDTSLLQPVYNQALGKVAYPMIVLLVIGTHRHDARSRRFPEPGWSRPRW